jgi:hypothetical protein
MYRQAWVKTETKRGGEFVAWCGIKHTADAGKSYMFIKCNVYPE